MGTLPTGTVTLLFTDIEGSTRLLEQLGDAYVGTLAEHQRVLRTVFERHRGVEVDTEGDAFIVAFPSSSDALGAAREAQAALAEVGPVRVRIGNRSSTSLVSRSSTVGLDRRVARPPRMSAAAAPR